MAIFDNESFIVNELDRRQVLKGIGVASAGLVGGGILGGCGGSGNLVAGPNIDGQILGAAKIAEALATSMYTALINGPIFPTLPATDQAYFTAARDEEKFHYDFLKQQTGGTDAPLIYYFPAGMFTNGPTTFNVLVTLEEAFIAAYLVGVHDLSTPDLRVIAAQILGVECEHRVNAKIAANDLNISSTTGLSGNPEANSPPNNDVYERRFGVTMISQAVAALKPFFDATAAATAGYTVTAPFDPTFVPTTKGLQGNPPS